jgi:RNase H-fold protein (predicted Holliday junction resolvase)
MEGTGRTILAIDPGRSKCGVAVVRQGEGALARAVVPRADLARLLRTFLRQYQPCSVILGKGTGSKDVENIVCQLENVPPVEYVDEQYTSLDARKRFFQENPPRGLKRLIPTGLQTPEVPYDDYVALILAERFLEDTRAEG